MYINECNCSRKEYYFNKYFHKIPIVRLYTADSTFENFIYLKIKGAFCLFMSKEKDIKNSKFFFSYIRP